MRDFYSNNTKKKAFREYVENISLFVGCFMIFEVLYQLSWQF